MVLNIQKSHALLFKHFEGLPGSISSALLTILLFQEEYDTHDPKGQCFLQLPFLRKRSKVIEIVAARGILFALTQSGVCAAFSRGLRAGPCPISIHGSMRVHIYIYICIYVNTFPWFHLGLDFWNAETNQRICFLNVSPDEVIRSLFYNKNNDSLITVSVYAADNFSSLKCRTTRIEWALSLKYNFASFSFFFLYFCNDWVHFPRYIRRGKPDAGFALFESESLKWPGFVEFDDVNGKVLTFSAQDW